MASIKLGRKLITENSLPYVIAEIGVNHEGSMDKAKELILLAKKGGADAVKFQSYKAEKLASCNSPSYWDLNKEPTTSQYELFKKYDNFRPDDFKELAEFCENNEITFLSTPFDDEAIDFLDALIPFYKVASADITNIPFLRKIALKHKPVVLSTGASTEEEIDLALNTLGKAGCGEVALLHCVLNYPTETENANLGMISYMREKYSNHIIGYSDHTLPDREMINLVTAYRNGAQIIEKHFTNDKTLPGNDHYHAMDISDLKNFLVQIAPQNNYIKKVPLETELISRKNARRSIVFTKGVQANTVLSEDMLTYKRPGTGISPMHWDSVIGMRTLKAFDADHILGWEDIESYSGTKVNVAAVIQARVGSIRFPGKIMADLAGKPIIEWIIHRTKKAKLIDKLVLAIPVTSQNDILEAYATSKDVTVIRGSEDDVLSRFVKAARILSANIIVRICADNPFIDPIEIDRLIDFFMRERPDYAFNSWNRMNNQYADGFGAEIVTRSVLEDMNKLCIKENYREHVTSYLWNNPHAYNIMTLPAPEGLAYPNMRFDVDNPEDLANLEPIAQEIGMDGKASDYINAKLCIGE